MIRIKASIVGIILVLHCFIAIAGEFYQATSKINIRSGTGKGFKIVGSISKGRKIHIDTIISGWGRVIMDGEARGFVSMKYVTKNFNTHQSNQEKESGYAGVIIVSIFIIFVLYKLFGKSIISSSNSSPSSSQEPRILWYYCMDCHTLVKTPKKPNNLNCRVNNSHRWYDLGELGDTTYICRDCGIQVRTTKRPTNIYCNVNGSHRWDKL